MNRKVKPESKELNNTLNSLQIKEVTMKREHDKNVWILIGIVSIIKFVGKNVFNYVDYKLLNLKNASNIQFQVRIIQIVFASAFSSCILHTKFPIHHIFSMIKLYVLDYY